MKKDKAAEETEEDITMWRDAKDQKWCRRKVKQKEMADQEGWKGRGKETQRQGARGKKIGERLECTLWNRGEARMMNEW